MIGNQEKIAVKLEVTNITSTGDIYGNVLLYLKNESIGYFNEEVNLRSFSYQFLRLIQNNKIFFSEFNEVSMNDVFKKLLDSKEVKYDSSIVSFGESFDDYIIRAIKEKNSVCILWELSSDHFYNYETPDYEVHFCWLEIDDLIAVHNELIKMLNDPSPSK